MINNSACNAVFRKDIIVSGSETSNALVARDSIYVIDEKLSERAMFCNRPTRCDDTLSTASFTVVTRSRDTRPQNAWSERK